MDKQNGRPPINIDVATARNLSMLGASLTDISRILGIGYSTLRERVSKDDELANAIAQGKGQGLTVALNELMAVIQSDKVTTHKMTAIKLYLQAIAPETWNPDYKAPPEKSDGKKNPSPDEARAFINRYKDNPYKSVTALTGER